MKFEQDKKYVFSLEKFKKYCEENDEDYEENLEWAEECEGKEPHPNKHYPNWIIDIYVILPEWCEVVE